MRYLLDTHAIIWFFENSAMMPDYVKEIIKHKENSISIATISLLEITIKESLNRFNLGLSIEELYEKAINNRFSLVHIKLEHLLIYNKLPFIHKDPYDRLLIATAINENLTFITSDKNCQNYSVNWIW